jgi:hypothetical protein
MWLGHPHLHIIGNTKDGFDAKIRDFIAKVLSIMGQPQATYFQKKFLVKGATKLGY